MAHCPRLEASAESLLTRRVWPFAALYVVVFPSLVAELFWGACVKVETVHVVWRKLVLQPEACTDVRAVPHAASQSRS